MRSAAEWGSLLASQDPLGVSAAIAAILPQLAATADTFLRQKRMDLGAFVALRGPFPLFFEKALEQRICRGLACCP